MSQLPRYESYKDSGVQWLGEIPSHWEVKRMKFVVANIGEKIDAKESDLRYFGLENIESFTGKLLDSVELESEGIGHRFQKDDVLFGKLRPYLAKVFLAQDEGLSSTEALVFRSSEVIYPKFLSYYCLSQDFINEVNGTTFGSKMPRASWDDISSFRMVYPSLDEQKIIADFLDKRLAQVDALIAKQETLLEKLAEQRVALISHAVTKGLNPDVEMKESGVQWLGEIPNHWKTTRIKFLGDIVLGLTYSPEDVTTSENGTLVLRSSNVQNGVLTLDDNVYVEKNIPKKMVTTDQDILICSRNGSRALIGKCALIEGEGVGQAFGAFMTVLRSPYRKYLYYVLSSDLFKYQIGSFLTSTINQLTTYALGNFEIAFPSGKEQKQITDYLDQELAEIEKVKDNIVKTLQTLQEYRSTLITQVVTGKIDVRNLKVN
ncbi:MAG: restriction endonuclease subunit S [Acinetobacter ursingii]|nr:restriction endonuclease subunit S [Acinetobacter ursingii]